MAAADVASDDVDDYVRDLEEACVRGWTETVEEMVALRAPAIFERLPNGVRYGILLSTVTNSTDLYCRLCRTTECKQKDNNKIVQMLLDRGAPPEPPGQDPTKVGVIMPIHVCVENNLRENLRALLTAGASVEAQDTHGRTPLFISTMSRLNPGIAEDLIERGADVDGRVGVTGRTAVHAAFLNSNDRVLGALLRAGASLHVRDCWGFTVVDYSAGRPNPVDESVDSVTSPILRQEIVRRNSTPLKYLCWAAAVRAELELERFVPPVIVRQSQRWALKNRWAFRAAPAEP